MKKKVYWYRTNAVKKVAKFLAKNRLRSTVLKTFFSCIPSCQSKPQCEKKFFSMMDSDIVFTSILSAFSLGLVLWPTIG